MQRPGLVETCPSELDSFKIHGIERRASQVGVSKSCPGKEGTVQNDVAEVCTNQTGAGQVDVR